jgi:hypothetical protein
MATNPSSTQHSRTLLPKKPLDKCRGALKISNPSTVQADMQFMYPVLTGPESLKPGEGVASTHPRETRQTVKGKEGGDLRIIEFDSSCAPQPFLDGDAVLARVKAARDEWRKGDEMK